MPGIEVDALVAPQRGGEVEPETVDLALVRPVLDRVADQTLRNRVAEVERVAAARGVDVAAVFRLTVVRGVVDAAEAVARLISKALTHKDSPEDLIDFVAKQCVSDPDIINLLPIHLCAEKLDKSTRKKLAHKISVPIVLSHYSINYDDEYDKPLSYAYEDFLLRNNLTIPSEVPKLYDVVDLELMTYYLRYICTPEIMKISTEFTGSAAVQDERLAVCSLLLEIDPKNSKEYESEIREITREQVIRKGVRHVEQSKMSIDNTTIRKWADKKLKENFELKKSNFKVY